MSDISNQGTETLEAVTKFLNSLGDHIDRRLIELGHILELQAMTAEARTLGEYISRGGEMTVVTVDDRIAEDLCKSLSAEKIGYLEGDIKGPDSVIFVPTGDLDKLKQIEADLLKEKGLNCYQMDMAELCQSTAKDDIENNRASASEIVELRGLTEDDALSLREQCNGIRNDLAIGIEREENGNYNFGIRNSQAFSMNPEVKDFAQAYLSSVIENYGIDNEIKRDRYMQDKNFIADLEAISVQRGDDPLYIIGKDCNNKYIEITDSGYSLYAYSRGENAITRDQIESVDISSPDYMYKLTAAAMTVKECEIVDKDHILSYLSNEHHSPETRKMEEIKRDEMELASKINEIVKTKMQKDPQFRNEQDCSVLLGEYVNQSKSILDDIANNVNPKGLTREQIDNLYSFVDNSNLDWKEYKDCKKVLDRFDSDIYKCTEREQHFEKKFDRNREQDIDRNNRTQEKEVGVR